MSDFAGMRGQIEIISGTAHPVLAKEVAVLAGHQLASLAVSRFPDGEIYTRIDTSVRGKDVFLVQPTCPPVNENFTEILIILDALYRASAGRVTAVIPYYGYARQDKKTAGREPITARMIADMLSAGGADRVLAIDLHSAQIQGFFSVPVDHLTALNVLTRQMSQWDLSDSVIVAPDTGRVGMASHYAERLGLPVVIIHKKRTGPEQTEVSHVVGEVRGKRPIIIDDMITTGGTIYRSIQALLDQGAKADIRVTATHPVLVGKAMEYLSHEAVSRLLVTNTLPIPPDKRIDKMEIISVAPLIADAIARIHSDRSVSDLFEKSA